MGYDLMWNIVRASAVGTSHAASGLPCQDDCYADIFQNHLICLVADGAGSAKKGGKGAELACSTARDQIEIAVEGQPLPIFDEFAVKEWIHAVRQVIHETAETDGLTARDYACTLLGAVIGPKEAVLFQIGDGAIVASSGSAQGVIFWPESGRYANETYFITGGDAFEHLQIVVTTARIDEIALFTDGLQRLALSFEQRIPHVPFFEPMLAVLRKQEPSECAALDEQLARFLDSPQINGRTDDDKTLLLASRRTA
jgi:hypothetical protein